MTDSTLELTKKLIAERSITPDDANCQAILIARLEKLGFTIEEMSFNDEHGTVKNLWARRGVNRPCLAFAGHTDVVPVGDIKKWTSDPFTPTEREGKLFGRGAADMKTSLAAFITSIEDFVTESPNHDGSIALLITADEEGPATCGTVKVIETLEARNEKIDYCLVGEPSSNQTLGDTIKNGRRGSIGCELTIIGVQGHIAYPQLADNPVHYCGDVINTLTAIKWDNGNDFFPPTSLQFSNINGGTGATNVIPETVQLMFNLRFSTEITAEQIQHKVATELDKLNIKYQINWTLSGHPFVTEKAELVTACQQAILEELNINTELSTSGGTSDGRFIAPTGAQVVELGPINESIHKVDESVDIDAPAKLSKVYKGIMERLLSNS